TVPGWLTVSGAWTEPTTGTTGLPAPFNGNAFFYAGSSPTAELDQDVDVTGWAATINAPAQQFYFSAWVRTSNKQPSDTGRIIVEYRDAANANVLGSLDSGQVTSGAEWIQLTDKRTAPAGTAFIRVRLIATRNSGATTDVYFDQVELRALGEVGVHLSGIVTDDGLPQGSTITSEWTKYNGPAAVQFQDAAKPITTAVVNAVGDTNLQLAASDSQLTGSALVLIRVQPANHAPVVDAGQNQTITNLATAQLSGSVQDDGIGALSFSWSMVSGPAAVTFSA